MIEVKAPNYYQRAHSDDRIVFLAGSIEMGTAEKWQDKVVTALADINTIVLNPRRDDFDPKASQEADNPYFAEQVNWELDALEVADVLVFYFDPNTKSPITLMELGLMANVREKVRAKVGYEWKAIYKALNKLDPEQTNFVTAQQFE